MGRLRTSLRELRVRLPAEDWRTLGAQARRHPLHNLLLESPFTRRAYEKPRGYAGDAGLMDLIYGLAPAGNLSPLGGMLYGYEFDSPCFQSVRTRRAVLAREIDSVAATRPGARVLPRQRPSADRMEPGCASGAATVTARADQDRLECIDQDFGRYAVFTMQATIGDCCAGACA